MPTPAEGEKALRIIAALFGGAAAGATGGLLPMYRNIPGGKGGRGQWVPNPTTGNVPGGLGAGIASQVLAGSHPDAVADYPERVVPFKYWVDYVEGPPQNNAMYKAMANPRVMRMQTLKEHNAALNKYIRPGMGPLQLAAAIKKGRQEEEELESFWTYDDRPRRDIVSSSSAVSDVHINPDGTISVRFRDKGKWYTYKGGADQYEAAQAAADLVTAPSMGRAINRYKGDWALSHSLWHANGKKA